MRILFFIVIFCSPLLAYPQSNGLISHYMFNPLIINPAYAGFDQALTVNAMVKNQWTGVEGSPNSQIFTAHAPLKKKVSLGVILANDQMGALNQKGIFATYAYRIPMAEGYLSMGLQAGTTFYSWQQENISLMDPLDPVFTTNLHNQSIPNFGAGFLYSGKNFYLGLSLPQLLQISPADDISYSLQRRNIIIQGSYSIPLSNDILVNPNTLLYFRKGHTAEMNVGVNFLFRKVIWGGVLYRNLNTLTYLAKININPQLNIGYALENHTGQVRSLSHNSHEFLVSYTFVYKKDKMVSPKYF